MSPERKLLERIIRHMEKQGEFAVAPNTPFSCVYRRETGNHKKVLRCAVGCLIPKSEYDPTIEGVAVAHDGSDSYLVREYAALIVVLEKTGLIKYREFLTKMQNLHDSCASKGLNPDFQSYLNNLKELRNEYA